MAVKVLLFADMRTHHANGWLAGLRSSGIDVSVLSSELADGYQEAETLASNLDPVSQARRFLVRRSLNQQIRKRTDRLTSTPRVGSGTSGSRVLQQLETFLTFTRIPAQYLSLRREIRRYNPDLVHALRFPYEGLLALSLIRNVPVVVSSWGQDFHHQASSDPLMQRWMRNALPACSGLIVDSPEDASAALEYGLRRDAPILLAAGNFGVDELLFTPSSVRDGDFLVLYPRGLRPYVMHNLFLDLVEGCRDIPGLRFVAVGLERDPRAVALANLSGSRLEIVPETSRLEYSRLLRQANAVVSPAISDGTPNSLLEAIATGAVVLAGDIPSLRALSELQEGLVLLPLAELQPWVDVINEAVTTHPRSDAASPALAPPFRVRHNALAVPKFYATVISNEGKAKAVPDKQLGYRDKLTESAKLLVRHRLARKNLDLTRDPFSNRLNRIMRAHDIGYVLDVGANVGQYAKLLRLGGFEGSIHSFEPTSGAYNLLAKRAKSDPRWIPHNIGLGSKDGQMSINVSENSFSSSMLKMESRHLDAAPRSRYVAQETVDIRRLDSILPSLGVVPGRSFLKIDTQGFEAEVLTGVGRLLGEFAAIQLELSLVPLYRGQVLFDELMSLMRSRNYDLYALEGGVSDRAGRTLQCDAVFVLNERLTDEQ